jgi:aminopeptidase-like protein
VAEEELGDSIHALVERLYPICRSITGEGIRETLRIVGERVPGLAIRAVPSGTPAFDWTVPREWNIRDAWVKGPTGEKVIDFRESNLHVVGYSIPVHRSMSLAALRSHLHTLPDQPQWIPYRTSYYKEDWGFCLKHRDYEKLPEGTYEVFIDATLEPGHLNYGEWLHRGDTEDEVLFTCHACHPSLCNDNLSGVAVATHLAQLLSEIRTRYSYRFLFIPSGIGSVVWLSRNQDRVDRIRHGLILSCLGDPGDFTYKRSRRGDAEVDQAVTNVLRCSGRRHTIVDFAPYGFDERNFCSPRFNLPVGSLTRSTHSAFPGYHSSGDNLDLVRASCLQESLLTYLEVVDVLENNRLCLNQIPEAEPQLGKRGLYGSIGGLKKRADLEMALLWVMNFSDGAHRLLDISDRSGYSFDLVREASDRLIQHGLLKTVDSEVQPCPPSDG